MMQGKKWRKLAAVLTACVLLMSCAGAALADDGYKLNVKDCGEDQHEITGYSGTLPSVLEIPDGITDIGYYAFFSVPQITEVVLPDTIWRIGIGAFAGCENLTTFHVPDSVLLIQNSCLMRCPKLTDLTLGSGVEEIEAWAFSELNIDSIDLPPRLEYLALGMLAQCRNLTSITIPGSVTSIQDQVFSQDTALREVNFGGSERSIGKQAFYGCSALQTLTLPEGLTSIGDQAFSHCDSLTTMYIPASVNSIGRDAFSHCALSEIRFGGSESQWKNFSQYYSTGVSSNVNVIYNASPDHSATPAPGFPQPAGGNGWIIAEHAGSLILSGITASAENAVTVADVVASFDHPDGAKIEVHSHTGELCPADSAVATGDQFLLTSSEGRQEAVTIIVRGDVLGSGRLDTAQIVRMAQALNGERELAWPYALAGALAGSGQISIADLVAEAQLIRTGLSGDIEPLAV